MELVHIGHYQTLPDAHAAAVHGLLEACEGEFVPPLSERSSTRQTVLQPGSTGKGGVDAYFAEMSRQAFLLAFDDQGDLLSFLSYIPSYELPGGIVAVPVAYVSTICTAHAARRTGLARLLYERLELVVTDRPLSLRTWSTNRAQLRLMHELGWREALRLVDDRGEGIDTIYYVKERCHG